MADAVAWAMKKLNITAAEASQLVVNNQLPTPKQDARGKASQMVEDREVLKRTVVVPSMIYDPMVANADGTMGAMVSRDKYRGGLPAAVFAFSGEKGEGGAPLARSYLVEGGMYVRNLNRMIELVKNLGVVDRSLPDNWSKVRGELRNMISQNATLIKKLDLQEALTVGEYEGGPEIKNLTGEFVMDRTAPNSVVLDRLQKLRDASVRRRDDQIDPLMTDSHDPTSAIGNRRSAAPATATPEK
jgi:hypothetical protein